MKIIVKIKTKNDLGLATDLKLVYSCLDLRPKSMDFLIQKTGLPPEKDRQSFAGVETVRAGPGNRQTLLCKDNIKHGSACRDVLEVLL